MFLLLLVFFVSLLIYKTHDDFHYYHFPYSYYLTEFPAQLGIGQFNHGFRTPSSIFYLNSLFYLPFIKYFSFYISAVLFLVFLNIILINKIKDNFKDKNLNYVNFLCLFFLIFINIFFYRVQEHGTDRSAQILILILFLYIIALISFEKNFEKNVWKILVVLGIIISLKAFYLIYFLLSIPIIYVLIKEKKTFYFSKYLKIFFLVTSFTCIKYFNCLFY